MNQISTTVPPTSPATFTPTAPQGRSTTRGQSADGAPVCPKCKGSLSVYLGDGESSIAECASCARRYEAVEGSIDFVGNTSDRRQERSYYEASYQDAAAPKPTPYDVEKWHARWHDRDWPGCRILLRRMGDVRGKRILLLGNGSSLKELYLAYLGAHVIHSDLSFTGVQKARNACDLSSLPGKASFHAVNAYEIPFGDNSIDIVYGFEFVHHLPKIKSFLAEVHRVLKPGGFCVFLDGAYSPIWQGLKASVFWPLKKLSHWRHPRSPEDQRATIQGGYKEEDLTALAKELGFVEPGYDRVSFFHYILTHGLGCVFGWGVPEVFFRIVGYGGRFLDRALTSWIGPLARSRIEIVWGFGKPATEGKT